MCLATFTKETQLAAVTKNAAKRHGLLNESVE